MNKIININLAGRLIPMNESAYESLSEYLGLLKQYFSKEAGGSDIVYDMEDRIGELFQEKIKKGAVAISEKDVAEVVTIMGRPDQILDETGVGEEGHSGGFDQKTNHRTNSSSIADKQLFRSRKEKVIGGVCGGLASHFNLDPAVVRVMFAVVTLFWGAGLLIYILLWILLPEKEDTAITMRRRWYRNGEQKVIGGVCSGIAAYLGVEPIWPRLIFLLPILLGMGFGVFADAFFPFSFGGFPSMILLYLILWIALPKANTLTEKLEMKGKKVDVKNISEAIKGPQQAASKKPNGCLSVLVVLLKAVLIFIGVIVLIVLTAVTIALISVLLGLGVSTSFGVPLSGLLLGSEMERIVLIISLLFILFIPLYVLIHYLIKLISGHRKPMASWWSTSLIILFLAGVFGVFSVAGSVLSDFTSHYEETEELPILPIRSDTLILSAFYQSNNQSDIFWDEDDLHGQIAVHFQKSKDSTFHVEIVKSARGANHKQAKENALNIQTGLHQKGNQIILPEALDISQQLPFRAQRLKISVLVPEGKYVWLQNANDDWWDGTISYQYNNGSFRIRESHTTREYESGVIYKMNASGVLVPVAGWSSEYDD